MSKITDNLAKALTKIVSDSQVSDFKADSVSVVLKKLAVKLGCAESVDAIRVNSIADVLKYIVDNHGSEEVEPYNLSRTTTKATVTVKRNGKAVTDGNDKLYNGDKLTITAVADEGYEITTFTVNGDDIESGDVITVNGHNVVIVATATEIESDGD